MACAHTPVSTAPFRPCLRPVSEALSSVDADRRLGLKRPFDVSESDSSDEAGQCIGMSWVYECRPYTDDEFSGHIETGRDLGSVVAAQSLPKRRFIEEQDSTAARDALYVRAYRIIQHRHAIKEMAQGNMAPMKASLTNACTPSIH